MSASLWHQWTGRGRPSSLVPLVGPAVGTLGLLVCPAGAGWYVFTFWALEPAVVVILFALLRKAFLFARRVFT